MITPRRTRLLKVPNLRTAQDAIAESVCHPDPRRTRQCVVLLPARAAAAELLLSLETRRLGSGALVLPDLLTREQWYERLHERAGAHRGRLGVFDREVLVSACARDAIAAGFEPPFKLRPGLIAEMVAFYDALRRQLRTLEAFERLVVDELSRDAEFDRGAERLQRQARFMAETFTRYERRLAESDALDEHALRAHMLSAPPSPLPNSQPPTPSPQSPTPNPHYRQVVVTVGDRVGDPDGLWPADFDLLTRLPSLEEIDIVSTERALAAGFRERLETWLPGIEEVPWSGSSAPPPVVIAPVEDEDRLWFGSRDREEELIDIARWIKTQEPVNDARASSQQGTRLHRAAVVFKRPLPYVYLGQQVFAAAGIPFETADALPLAAEPYVAALDLVFDAVTSGFTRSSVIALMRSPHFSVRVGPAEAGPHEEGGAHAKADAGHYEVHSRGVRLQPDLTNPPEGGSHEDVLGQIALLDRALSEAGYLGDPDTLRRLADRWDAPAARVAADLVTELEPLTLPAPASEHVHLVLEFLRRHERLPFDDDPTRERHVRARGAVLVALAALQEAHLRHDDPRSTIDEVAAMIRRWIEDQTFSPRSGTGGLHLVDAQSARFGDFDEVFLVGLVDRDWPGGVRRNIFFPPGILNQLGWPREADRLAAGRAAFEDLLWLAARSVRLSSVALEDDAVVERSPFVDDVERSGLAVVRVQSRSRVRIHPDEALSLHPPALEALPPASAAWAHLRFGRESDRDQRFHGYAGPQQRDSYSISALDRYLDCPFKYFATHVLKLQEDPDEDALSAPKVRGQFFHDVLRKFFEAWKESGRGAITLDNIDEARTRFREVVDAALVALPDAEAALERMRLLGSLVSPGFGEAVLRAELEDPRAVIDRLLELPLESEITLPPSLEATADGRQAHGVTRTVTLRGVADRVDLLADGTFRVVDYKLGRAPDLNRAIQLPMYALCSRERLAGHRGRSWEPSSAAYLVLSGRKHVHALADDEDWQAALESGKARCLEALAGIEAGEFPPRPQDPFYCGFCPYSGVCRKDYVDVE